MAKRFDLDDLASSLSESDDGNNPFTGAAVDTDSETDRLDASTNSTPQKSITSTASHTKLPASVEKQPVAKPRTKTSNVSSESSKSGRFKADPLFGGHANRPLASQRTPGAPSPKTGFNMPPKDSAYVQKSPTSSPKSARRRPNVRGGGLRKRAEAKPVEESPKAVRPPASSRQPGEFPARPNKAPRSPAPARSVEPVMVATRQSESESEDGDSKNPFGDPASSDEELGESNPFAEPNKSETGKGGEANNPFGSVGSSDDDDLDESNPFAVETKQDRMSSGDHSSTSKPTATTNPFGDVSSDDSEDQYPGDTSTPKPANASKYETYDKRLNPFEETFAAKPAPGRPTSKRPAPRRPAKPPSRPPPPSLSKIKSMQAPSNLAPPMFTKSRSETVTSSETSGSGKASTKRTAPPAPIGPRKPNDSQINYEATLEGIQNGAEELAKIVLEMDDLEPTINEPRPSKFTQDRWNELVTRKTEITMQQNKLLLEKELYEVCEHYCRTEHKMRMLHSKAVRTPEEEEELDRLGDRLQRIVNTKVQIDDQLNRAQAPALKRNKKKTLKMGIGKSIKRLTLKPK